MVKERFVLTENAWSVRSSEGLADISYCTLALLAVLVSTIFNFSIFGISTLILLGLGVGFYFYLQRLDTKPYLFSLVYQTLLLILMVPIPFLHPVGIVLAYVSGALFYFFANQNFSLKLESTFFILFFFFFWESILQLLGFKFGSSPEVLYFPFLDSASSSSLGSRFSSPWYLTKDAIGLSFRSLFEYFSSFLMVGLAIASFRRLYLFLSLLLWILIFGLFSVSGASLGTTKIISYSSLAFLIFSGPGKNHYTLFFPNLFLLICWLPVAWIFANFGIPALWLIFLFFLFQSIIARVFLGK